MIAAALCWRPKKMRQRRKLRHCHLQNGKTMSTKLPTRREARDASDVAQVSNAAGMQDTNGPACHRRLAQVSNALYSGHGAYADP